MGKYDIVIIGAGISGLSLAHYCAKEGLKTLVIEKTERVGGTLHSNRFEDTNEFWIEMGAHTCYNSYRNLIEIMEDCTTISRLVRREKVPFKMLVDGQIKSIPSQLNFLELFCSAPRLFTLKKEGQSVESYYSRILGRTNYERVLAPAMNAVISQNANDFPADMLFKKRTRRKDIMKKFSLISGVQTITDSISSQKNIEILRGTEVLAVNFDNGYFQITTSNATYESDSLAIATPASAASKLLRESFPQISESLASIRVNSVESVGVAVRADLISLPLVAGIIPSLWPSSDIFYSVVSRDTVKDNTYRGFTFHFKPNSANQDAKLKRISEVLGVKQGQLDHVITKENLVPSLKVGHDSLVWMIDHAISESRLLLTGNYFDGMAIEDCVSRSLKEFVRLKKLLGRS
ncbi:MAG: FAD-dependent oxidoreductase [Nitrospirae bacterium]|nr:FAD-dependent oxidoreductase [Nitrospirota bacterium]MDA8338813.1 FAD-dependent oxidoreductase [Nitrospiraceae bacterium]